jgi:hypothetical protein
MGSPQVAAPSKASGIALGQRLTRFWKAFSAKQSRKIQRQDHYGTAVWTHLEMDALRKTECLCRLCERCNPGQPEHCAIASAMFQVCVAQDIALAVTRCPHFSPLPDGKPGAWTTSKA